MEHHESKHLACCMPHKYVQDGKTVKQGLFGGSNQEMRPMGLALSLLANVAMTRSNKGMLDSPLASLCFGTWKGHEF